MYRSVKAISTEAFGIDLRDSPIVRSLCSSLEELVDQYNTSLLSIMDAHAPIKKRHAVIRPEALWLTSDIIEARKVCRRPERHWRRTRLDADLKSTGSIFQDTGHFSNLPY